MVIGTELTIVFSLLLSHIRMYLSLTTESVIN